MRFARLLKVAERKKINLLNQSQNPSTPSIPEHKLSCVYIIILIESLGQLPAPNARTYLFHFRHSFYVFSEVSERNKYHIRQPKNLRMVDLPNGVAACYHDEILHFDIALVCVEDAETAIGIH